MANETQNTNDVETEQVDAQLVDLVSYLDGELPNDQAESVERKLVSDPVMRSDADILSRTWAMLDSLDEVSGSRQFTQSTLQCVAAEAKKQPVTRKVRSYRILKTLAEHHVLPLFLMGAAFAAAGLAVSQSTGGPRGSKKEMLAVDRIVLEEFDMLQNLELYQRVPNAEVLQQLDLDAAEPAVSDAPSDESNDEEVPL